jgi:hypothetical protein
VLRPTVIAVVWFRGLPITSEPSHLRARENYVPGINANRRGDLSLRGVLACSRNFSFRAEFLTRFGGNVMHSIIYIIGLIVVVMAVLSLFGLR